MFFPYKGSKGPRVAPSFGCLVVVVDLAVAIGRKLGQSTDDLRSGKLQSLRFFMDASKLPALYTRSWIHQLLFA